jgi:hypothetical protein
MAVPLFTSFGKVRVPAELRRDGSKRGPDGCPALVRLCLLLLLPLVSRQERTPTAKQHSQNYAAHNRDCDAQEEVTPRDGEGNRSKQGTDA